ncbi:hypothetical protein SAMCCGM7_Ch0810 [Sinorhizobium americanum CCGM7]|nr:hypothetical protein SAMCCGM7_Ch0810 [Sinorhizobium americanum CCGM7]
MGNMYLAAAPAPRGAPFSSPPFQTSLEYATAHRYWRM